MRKLNCRKVAKSKRASRLPLTLATFLFCNIAQLFASTSTQFNETLSSVINAPVPEPISAMAQAQTPPGPNWTTLEQEILLEHNRVRQDPQSYIPILENYLEQMTSDGLIIHGCGQGCVLTTREGRAAVEEAIAFLQNQPPVGPISQSTPVAQAAKALAQEQQSGQTGHVSSDGSSFLQRLTHFGVRSSAIGENISYGATSAQDVIMKLIIDDGVPSRGHRINLFSASWEKAGAGCGTHARYRTVCVIDYAI